MITIEISQKMMISLNKRYIKTNLDLEHIPFAHFRLQCNRSKEEEKSAYKQLLEAAKKEKVKITNEIKKTIEEFSKGFVAEYTISENNITIKNRGSVTVYPFKDTNNKILDFKRGKEITNFGDIKIYNLDGKDITEEVIDNSNKEECAKDIIRNIITLNGIIQYLISDKKNVKVVTNRKPSPKTRNKNKKHNKKKNVTYITNKRYIIQVPKEENKKREYNLTAASWPVRGHWRHYKNGKTVWIETYTKHEDTKNNINKTYKVGSE